ncbi:MAG: MBL fold metallo-hydrolase [Myxococcaceae bacterium]
MSEAMAGVPAMPVSSTPPRDAAAVVLFRRVAAGVEVFWLEREQKLSFAGGFFAFPGGKVDRADAAIAVTGAQGDHGRCIATAAREVFEETGVLLARGPAMTQAQRDEERRALLDEKTSFAEVLARHQLSLHAGDFHAAGRWVTPPYLPRGFDARFFLAEAPGEQQASVWKGELTDGEWIAPRAALERWENGTALLHPPNLHALRTMAAFRDVAGAVQALSNPPFCTDFIAERIEFQRGVVLYPLKTPTLPPATHTATLILGTRECVIIDPGSPDEAEIDRLVAFLARLKHEGFAPLSIVLTHHHGDHLGGLELLVKKTGLPVWAHAQTADRSPVPVARLLADGEVLALDGPRPMRWRVLHTPGHARGHITLVDEATRAAVVGDMVAGVGTIVIDPPEGEMAEYLRQLERLRDLPVRTLYPAHGPVIPDGPAKLNEYLMHRAWREEKVLEALRHFGAGGASVEELVPKAYDDVAAFVWPIAERNTVAILEKLITERRACVAGDKYSA